MSKLFEYDPCEGCEFKVAYCSIINSCKNCVRKGGECAGGYVITATSSIPPIQLASVISCKACKNRELCQIAQQLGPDGYCSNGEYMNNDTYEDAEDALEQRKVNR